MGLSKRNTNQMLGADLYNLAVRLLFFPVLARAALATPTKGILKLTEDRCVDTSPFGQQYLEKLVDGRVWAHQAKAASCTSCRADTQLAGHRWQGLQRGRLLDAE